MSIAFLELTVVALGVGFRQPWYVNRALREERDRESGKPRERSTGDELD